MTTPDASAGRRPAWHTRLLWWWDDHGGAPDWYVRLRGRWVGRHIGRGKDMCA